MGSVSFWPGPGADPRRCLHLRPGLRLYVLSRRQAIVTGDGLHLVLEGEEQVSIAQQIDGTRSAEEIAAFLSDRIGELRTLAILDQLGTGGICTTGQKLVEDPIRGHSFWRRQGLPAERISVLGSRRVLLEYLGEGLEAVGIDEALGRSGIRCIAPGGSRSADLHLVVAPDPLDSRLSEVDRRNREAGQPWMLASTAGSLPLFAPFLGGADEPCWVCVAFWLRANRPVEEYLRRRTGASIPSSAPALEPAGRVLAEHLALAVGRFLIDPEPGSPDVVSIDGATLRCDRHAVRRRPQCPACGHPGLMSEQGYRPIELDDVPRIDCEDGGVRRMYPEAAWERFRHLVSPVTGPVSHLGPMHGRHTPTRPVFVSGFRVCPTGETIDANSFQRVCAGKGRSLEQSRASALFEAIERFCGLHQGDEARVRASWKEIGPEAIHPHALQLFSAGQQAAWTEAELERSGAHRIAASYGGEEIDWTPAWSLTHRRRRYVPLSYCFAETPPDVDRRFVCYTGNGVAAGTCMEEAILQGVFELVERDAVAVWWYNRIPRPPVELSGLHDPYVERLQGEYQGLGWDLWVLDLTHDLAMPVHAALARSRRDHRFSIGFGCHLDGRIALHRALTELNQLFDPQGELRAPWNHAALPSDRFLFPDSGAKRHPPMESGRTMNLRDDVEECIRRLGAFGLELVVVDRSRPDLGVRVAQSIVPGLRHFWPRFAPGRLYEVPVALGWLDAPLAEQHLNPVPLLV